MNLKDFNILPVFKDGALSLFSDGKFSMKRLLAFIFGIAILWMTRHLLYNVIPKDNQMVFMHCFDIIAGLIGTLLVAATVKDAYVQKGTTTTTDTKIEDNK